MRSLQLICILFFAWCTAASSLRTIHEKIWLYYAWAYQELANVDADSRSIARDCYSYSNDRKCSNFEDLMEFCFETAPQHAELVNAPPTGAYLIQNLDVLVTEMTNFRYPGTSQNPFTAKWGNVGRCVSGVTNYWDIFGALGKAISQAKQVAAKFEVTAKVQPLDDPTMTVAQRVMLFRRQDVAQSVIQAFEAKWPGKTPALSSKTYTVLTAPVEEYNRTATEEKYPEIDPASIFAFELQWITDHNPTKDAVNTLQTGIKEMIRYC